MSASRAALWVTASATAAGLLALYALAAIGWPGTPIDCTALLCWCEETSAGPWRQPVNTWSNVVPLLGAFAVAFDAGRPVNAPLPKFLGVTFPLALVFQGWGSMVFHASLVDWAGVVDAMSMFAVVGLLVAINLYRGGKLTGAQLPAFWLAFSSAGVAVGVFAPEVVSPVMGVLFVVVLGSEVWLHARDPGLPKRWFRAGVVVFMLGVAVWYGSAIDGMPLCAPRSPWQGHAVWHITSAAAIGLFWLHARESLVRVSAR